MSNATPQSASRFINIPEVTARTTLRKTAIYELIKAGELCPVKLGRKTVFSEAEVTEWMNKRLSNREA